MKNYLVIVVIASILFSCKKEKPVSQSIVKNKKDSVKAKENYTFDANSIFGVYQLTDKDFAICIPVQFDNENLPLSKEYQDFITRDSLPWIYGKEMKNYKYYDTLFVDKLIYNKKFEDVFKKKIKESFFTYGTKSYQICKVKRVVFQSNECENDYIAYILNVDKNIIGNPLIASEKEIPLDYGKDYIEVNEKIKNFASKKNTEMIHGNRKYNPIVFSNYKNLYFTFYDDFKWYKKNSDSYCQFPERAIFEISEKGKIKYLWNSEMDLLGLPCL
ncbi:hypothetical protein SAMN05443633_10465 [Chryseobacterium arachidis]|uniref:Uncharacterized protein n=1 Tax=Chryseobacterium arachidis TaxID=1416778 RepID=A0A1M5B7I5_9FLAO|nr:hypothetical protein [Chryseobacterium arachidis]SHF38390.1 hypothetical protein SAMN05443633_10465 [Chryseobacterium arachidis]